MLSLGLQPHLFSRVHSRALQLCNAVKGLDIISTRNSERHTGNSAHTEKKKIFGHSQTFYKSVSRCMLNVHRTVFVRIPPRNKPLHVPKITQLSTHTLLSVSQLEASTKVPPPSPLAKGLSRHLRERPPSAGATSG